MRMKSKKTTRDGEKARGDPHTRPILGAYPQMTRNQENRIAAKHPITE